MANKFTEILDILIGRNPKSGTLEKTLAPVNSPKTAKKSVLPPKSYSGGRSSQVDTGAHDNLIKDKANRLTGFTTPEFNPQLIPLIRKMYKQNGDMGLVLYDLLRLTNTGHIIKFSEETAIGDQNAMRRHLKEKGKTWGDGTYGIPGLVDKMIMQAWVAGAISFEPYPNKELNGVENVAFVNPENIRFKLEKGRYTPYQISLGLPHKNNIPGYIKLNKETYRYIGIFTDLEVPYGTPPFIPALFALAKQKNMDCNIDNILELMGLLGFLNVKIEKPDQGEMSDSQYKEHLEAFQEEVKNRVSTGLKDGISVGYMEDIEYDFHSTTQNLEGVTDLYTQNEVQIANGLKVHASFMGVTAGKSETHLSIIFTKMLSQLNHIHTMLAYCLEHLYQMELMLSGYGYQEITVKFNTSTILDELKYQQANEIKIRNLEHLYDQGIISQEEFADETGYMTPDQEEPRVSREAIPPDQAEKDQDHETKKDANDRKNREKAKPQPKRKDTKTE